MYDDSPPPYESVIGPGRPDLNCVSFWPECLDTDGYKAKYDTFKGFDDVLARANDWLSKNPCFQLVCCETSQKKVVLTADIYQGSMKFIAGSDGHTAVKIKGLRLWYKVRSHRNSDAQPGQKLDIVDIKPQMSAARTLRDVIFEDIPSMVERFNTSLQIQPLPGRIVSIETVVVSMTKSYWEGRIDSLATWWPDSYKIHKLYFLRVYYLVGTPTREIIGLADFVPDQTGDTDSSRPRPSYSDMDSIMDKASAWASASSGICVTNLQTLDTRYWRISELGRRLETMGTFDYNVESRHRVLFVRVAFTKPQDSLHLVLPPTPRLCHRTFVPAVVSVSGSCCSRYQRQHEDLFTTMERVRAWLNVTGCQVVNAEILSLPDDMLHFDI